MKAAERDSERGGIGRYPTGPAVVPHRKNAAERVMWAALWPVAWVVVKLTRCRRDDANANARGT
jgi:hypothetical protein